MSFEPVRTKADLDTLDDDEILEGYLDGLRGEPLPGDNRSRAYWHGFRCALFDRGRLTIDEPHRALAHEYVEAQKKSAGQ
jgi:hypothetical protein